MRLLTTFAVVVVSALMWPSAASAITFGEWASGRGYSPADVMPRYTAVNEASIDNLDGIGLFDWTTTPTTRLWLSSNQISSIEQGDFDGLTNLERLDLYNNQLSSIESGVFSGLTNLERLHLYSNQLTSIESGTFSGLTNLTTLSLNRNRLSSIELGAFSGLTNLRYLDLRDNELSSIESGAFGGLTNLTALSLSGNQLTSIESGVLSGLTNLTSLLLEGNQTLSELKLAEVDFSNLTQFDLAGNVNITSISLKNAIINQTSLSTLLNGNTGSCRDYCPLPVGIGDLDGIAELDLSGIDFVNITDPSPLFAMDNLTDLWLVDTLNLDASGLDVLLDNLDTIEGTDTEGILYMTQADYDAFNTAGGDLLATWDDEPGHHVAFVIPEPTCALLAILASIAVCLCCRPRV